MRSLFECWFTGAVGGRIRLEITLQTTHPSTPSLITQILNPKLAALKPLDLDGAQRPNTLARLPTGMGTVAPTSFPVPEHVLLETSTGPLLTLGRPPKIGTSCEQNSKT